MAFSIAVTGPTPDQIRELQRAGLLPQECRHIQIDMPINGVQTITFVCNLIPEYRAVIEALMQPRSE